MVKKLQKNDFQPHLNEQFAVYVGEIEPVKIELVEISDRSAGKVESFSLFFRNVEGKFFPHNTYQITHPIMGELVLFLGPVETDKTDGIYYEAVFNNIES